MVRGKKITPKTYETLTLPFTPLNPDATFDDLGDLGQLEENEFRGFASVFGMVVDAWCPTIMQRGAFTKTLKERSRDVVILWQHDMSQPIGKPTRLFETDQGLVLQAKIARTALGRDALTLLREGVVQALSIGFEPIISEEVEQEDGNIYRHIREARLIEVSIVTLGADPNALITEVRSGCIAGKLEQHSVEESIETNSEVAKPTLISKLEEFMTTSGLDIEDEKTLIESFAATLKEAAPTSSRTSDGTLAAKFRQLDLLTTDLTLD